MRPTLRHMRNNRRWLLLAIVALVLALPRIYVYREMRQMRLNRQLIAALGSRDDALALRLLKGGASGSAREESGPPPGVRELLSQMLRRLLHRDGEAGSNPRRSTLAILYAAVQNFSMDDLRHKPPGEELVLALLDAGAPANGPEPGGQSILTSACEFNQHQLVRRLLELGADANAGSPGSYTALESADAEDAKLLLEHGARPDVANEEKQTPIFAADAAKTKVLLEHGASLTVRDQWEHTPLSYDCIGDHDDAVLLLLAHGADPNVHDWMGSSPLLGAAADCKLEIIQAIVRAGGNVRARDMNGTTALIIAITNRDHRVVDWLLTQGIDVNAHGIDKSTALGVARYKLNESIQYGKKNMYYAQLIQKLKAHGAKDTGQVDVWYGEEGD